MNQNSVHFAQRNLQPKSRRSGKVSEKSVTRKQNMKIKENEPNEDLIGIVRELS